MNPIHPYRADRSFIPVLVLAISGMHGVALGGAGFVNDALEEPADGSVGQWTRIILLSVRKHFVLPVGLVQRNFRRLFELADFESAARPLVQEFDEFLVDFVDAASQSARLTLTPPGERGHGGWLV